MPCDGGQVAMEQGAVEVGDEQRWVGVTHQSFSVVESYL
jgi:hypothetical protein